MTDEINPDDFDMSYEKGEEISGTSDREASVLFTWKGEEYEVEITIHESWDNRSAVSDRFIDFDSPKPKELSDEEWEQIQEWIEEEVR